MSVKGFLYGISVYVRQMAPAAWFTTVYRKHIYVRERIYSDTMLFINYLNVIKEILFKVNIWMKFIFVKKWYMKDRSEREFEM